MELLSLTCGHCGAPLEVPQGTRYVTCGYCSSKLEVHRSGGAIYTEVLEALQKRTEEIADEVKILKLQNELQRLERECHEGCAACMVGDKHGYTSNPSLIYGSFLILFGVGMSIYAVTSAGTSGSVMIFIMLFFIAIGSIHFVKSIKLSKIKDEYKRRREAVLQAIRDGENEGHEVPAS